MAESFNKVTLVGRVTKDVEVKVAPSGTKFCSYNIAVNNRKGKDGNDVPADFFTCCSFNGTADYVSNYAKKGALILVSGRLRNRTYQNKEGQNVHVTEVMTDTVQILQNGGGGANAPKGTEESYDLSANDFLDDEI